MLLLCPHNLWWGWDAQRFCNVCLSLCGTKLLTLKRFNTGLVYFTCTFPVSRHFQSYQNVWPWLLTCFLARWGIVGGLTPASSVVRRREQLLQRSPKLPGQFLPNFTGMVLWWSSFRFLKIMTLGPKMAPPGGLSVFHKKIFKKSSSLKLLGQFLQYFTGMFLGWSGWSSFRFLKIMTPGPKMAPPEGLSVFHKKIFKKSSPLKLLGQFLQNFTGMVLGWSSFSDS